MKTFVTAAVGAGALRGLVAIACLLLVPTTGLAAKSAETLRSAKSFADIENEAERSKALFSEAGKVIQHPRCVNCHPRGDQPRQGENMTLHQPPVARGPNNFGVAGMRCNTCHQPENVAYANVPGHPKWHLAPKSMAWYDKPLGEICEQIKDEDRNGGMSHDEIVEHMAKDSLVGWGWHPGPNLEPVPGDQKTFGRLIAAWVETGAHCPGS